MAEIDRDAIERRGVPGRLLMEVAGRAVAQAIRARFPDSRAPLLLCGGGNNGGDGFVVARVLREWDAEIRPTVFALGEAARRSPEAAANFELLLTSGVEVVLVSEQKEIDPLLARADLVVDAMFGVGLVRAVEGTTAELLAKASRAELPVVAVDLPSGVSSDTGEPLGTALPADLIVTLGLPKLGLAVCPFDAEIWVADIGLLGASIRSAKLRQHVWTRAAAAMRLPARALLGHKGSFGHVLVVGGSAGKTGAAVLAAEGAVFGGAGLVTVATPDSLSEIFAAKLTEAMSLPYADRGAARLVPDAIRELREEALSRDVLVLGPGIGSDPSTREAAREFIGDLPRAAVIDADGLNAFAGEPEALRCEAPRLLTPHPGEMARLLARSTDEIQADRVAAARELARRADAVALLKGARSVVASPGGEVHVNPTGGPGLATGGTGDVLAGLCGALLAQGLSGADAAALAAWVHGRAGDRLGPVTSAGAVARQLPAALAELRESGDDLDGSETLRRFP